MTFHVLHFGGNGLNRNFSDQNKEYLMNWNNKFEIHLPQIPTDVCRKGDCVALFAEVCAYICGRC
jgi:hypothetical protein